MSNEPSEMFVRLACGGRKADARKVWDLPLFSTDPKNPSALKSPRELWGDPVTVPPLLSLTNLRMSIVAEVKRFLGSQVINAPSNGHGNHPPQRWGHGDGWRRNKGTGGHHGRTISHYRH